MKKYLRIYKESMRIALASATTYRANFILQSMITLLSNIIFPLITLLIYGSGASFKGWDLYEVLLIQSIFTISIGISSMLFDGIVWNTMSNVVDGTLEIILIKPVDSLFFLLASTFNINSLGIVIGGGIVFGIALVHIAMPTLIMWIQCIVMFVIGILVLLGMELMMAATSFKWVANSRIPEMYQSVIKFGNYPLNIFPKWIVAFTSFIMPVAMIGFFPASALLGRTTWWMFLAIIPCIIFMASGILLYKYMVRLYESVGG
jgi:ABC-2 type transport system permease protein